MQNFFKQVLGGEEGGRKQTTERWKRVRNG